MLGCCRYTIFAVLAVVVVSVVGQSSERALNATGLWSKYNLIVKPTADGTIVTTPPATDARYKSGVVIKNKYGLKTDDKDLNRPYLTNHRISIDSGSEEEQISQEVEDDVTEEEGDDVDEDEDFPLSDEQDEVQLSTTQRSQAIHHKAPVKVAVIDATTKKSIERKTHKKKKGHKPSAAIPATPATTVIHHHVLGDDDDSIDTHGHQKGHKHKGVKKYKIKGLKKLRKYMLPLLLAYKLKFFTLVPLLLGGLILIVASTGFAGFFFALFAVGVGLKKD